MPIIDKDAMVCGNCGKADDLMECKRCTSAVYCSKECQRAHWPEHKSFCDKCNDERKRGKKVVKGEEPFEIAMTHAGPVVVNIGESGNGPVSSVLSNVPVLSSPGGPVPSGLPLLRKALYELMSHRSSNIQYGEKAYMNMYDDLVQNEKEWLEFFRRPMNEEHCSDACHLLNMLSEILYHRCDLEVGGNVVEMSSKLFSAAEYPKQNVENWDDIERALLTAKYQFNQMVCNYAANVSVYRRQCEREIEKGMPGIQGDNSKIGTWKIIVHGWGQFARSPVDGGDMPEDLLKQMLAFLQSNGNFLGVSVEKAKHWGELGRKCEGAKTLDDLSDDLVEEILRSMNEIAPMTELHAEEVNRDVQLRTCGNCNKKESACGEFPRCNRCKSIVYCGKACQVDHWKVHKKVCTKKKKK